MCLYDMALVETTQKDLGQEWPEESIEHGTRGSSRFYTALDMKDDYPFRFIEDNVLHGHVCDCNVPHWL